MTGDRPVSLVVPARNEAASLATVLSGVPRDAVDEVVVVVGPSLDATLAVAHAAEPAVHVVEHHTPHKGAALRAGLAAARGDVLVVLDADGTMDPAVIPALLAALALGPDLVTAGRAPGGSRRAGRRRNPRQGLLAVGRHHLDVLDLDAPGPDATEVLLASAARAGLVVGGLAAGPRRFAPRRFVPWRPVRSTRPSGGTPLV